MADTEGSISRDSKLNIADVVVNGNEYSFQVNSNGTINLIKDGLKYGTFKTSEAKLVDNSYIDIEDKVFGRYFGFYGLNQPVPGPAKQPFYNTIFNSTTDNKLSGAAKMHIWNLDNLYGNLLNNDVPKAEASLVRTLDPLIQEDSKRDVYGAYFTYDISDAITKITSLNEHIKKYSDSENVPQAMMASVLFREIMFFSKQDQALDWRDNATKGISQVSVEGVRIADRVISEKEKKPLKFNNVTDKEIADYLDNSDQMNVLYAAMALKRSAYAATTKDGRINVELPIITNDREVLVTIFANYNGNPGPSGIKKKIVDAIGVPSYSMWEYGEQTYRYYVAFNHYYKIIDRNRVK